MTPNQEFLVAALSVFGVVITAVALILSLIQTQVLKDIGRSLSTRYIGKFPSYIADLTSLVESAETSLTIFCDFPAYGRFSAPNRWLDYRQSLERKIRSHNFDLSFTCFDHARRIVESREQFEVTDQIVKEWHQDSDFRARLQGLLYEYGSGLLSPVNSVQEIDAKTFLALLEVADLNVLERVLTAPAIVREVTDLPLFFWIADEKEAIFSFPSGGSEYGFRTLDPKLISAFMDLKHRHHTSRH